MPLTLIVSDGVLPEANMPSTIQRLSEAFLRLHGLSGNKVLTPNVVGHVQVVPKGHTFSGLVPTDVAVVEWLTPSFAFTSRDVQKAYVREATEIVYEACGGRLARTSIWVNVKHAVDGTWGIAGIAYSNSELGEAMAAA
ncbi:MAG TPA: 4-oxalocrotonate tautomerase [Hydrogenophaga sp.]